MDSDTRAILFVDVDGVISLFGFPSSGQPPGHLYPVDGVSHCIGHGCGDRLNMLSCRFELVWATGWEDRANEHLPDLLGLAAAELPSLTFDGLAVFGSSDWKLDAIDRYAGDRPAAWVDDNIDEHCERWARGRGAPTLLVRTESAVGITDKHVELLLRWADQLAERSRRGARDG